VVGDKGKLPHSVVSIKKKRITIMTMISFFATAAIMFVGISLIAITMDRMAR